MQRTVIILQKVYSDSEIEKMRRGQVAIACLGVLIAVCSAGIPDPRVPAPPQKEDDGSYPIYADLTNADIKSGQELNSDQRSKMPDLSDGEVRKTLKCGICEATVREFAYNIAVAEWEAADEGHSLRSFDYVEVMDKVCPENMDPYGLVLTRDGTPSTEWSNEDALFRAKGGQITRLVKNTCTEIQNEYEDELKDEAPKLCTKGADIGTCRTVQLAKKLCGTKGLKYCSDERIKDFQDIEDLQRGKRDKDPRKKGKTDL